MLYIECMLEMDGIHAYWKAYAVHDDYGGRSFFFPPVKLVLGFVPNLLIYGDVYNLCSNL